MSGRCRGIYATVSYAHGALQVAIMRFTMSYNVAQTLSDKLKLTLSFEMLTFLFDRQKVIKILTPKPNKLYHFNTINPHYK